MGGKKMTSRRFAGILAATSCVFVGCSDDGSPVEILAEAASLPDDGLGPSAVFVSTSSELAETWERFGFSGPPDVSLADGHVLFIGTVESGSCPAKIDYVGEPPSDLDVAADVFVEVGYEGGPDCDADANACQSSSERRMLRRLAQSSLRAERPSPLSGLVELAE